MKTIAIAGLGTMLLSATGAVSASEAMPAWQEPGFVMEEVIAVAPARIEAAELAWQESGFVMEEIVVTANAREISASRGEQARMYPRTLLARRFHRHSLERMDADIPATDGG